MSIASNFPAIKPSLLLDFSNTEALDSRITFTRASTATYYGTQTAKAEENLLLQSQAFDQWTTSNVTVTANSIAAPDGTTTADTLQNNTTLGAHGVYRTIAFSTGASMSVFAKAGTANFVGITNTSNPSVYSGATFNLSTGAVGTTANCTASIVSLGNGWYRCCVANTTVNAGAFFVVSVLESDAAPWSGYTGTTKDIYIWGAQLEQRSSVTAYTATTTQPITNYIPQLLTAQSGVARFDSNPTTGESLGLLIEEQRTNLVTYSEQFDNAVWTKTNSTITANTIVAPDGTLTGDKLVENTANSTHQLATAATSSATSATFSFYAKPAERSEIIVQCYTSPANTGGTVQFNLLSKTVVSQTVISTGTVSGASITDVGDGWVRCVVSVTGTSSTNLVGVIYLVSGTNTYTGNGYSGIYIWGAQLEAGSFPASYIKTEASQVTRAADAASMTGANFSSWYRQDEGTVYSEWNSAGSQGNGNLIAYSISDNTFDNSQHLIVATSGASNQTSFSVRSSATTSASTVIAGAYTNYSYRKTATTYQVNNFAAAANGGAVVTDTSGNAPYAVNRLYIGASWVGSSNFLNGTIRKLAFYPARLTNAQLQGLTS